MNASAPVTEPLGARLVPKVRLFDARQSQLAEMELRALVRHYCHTAAPCSSRSYRYPLALAALHQAPVGIDLERIEHHDLAFAQSICTPRERAATGRKPNSISHLWCSKEALSKALGNASAYDPRYLESPLSWPQGRCGPWRACALDVAGDHVAWVVWMDTH